MTNNHFLDKIALDMTESFKNKSEFLKKKFTTLSTQERYLTLMDMGKNLPAYEDRHKTTDRIVRGCQSTLYLYTELREGKLYFEAHADALISAGLAALLIALYSGEPPETILTQAPDIIKELDIGSSLSPNRSNGLANIHLKMKQEALFYLTKNLK